MEYGLTALGSIQGICPNSFHGDQSLPLNVMIIVDRSIQLIIQPRLKVLLYYSHRSAPDRTSRSAHAISMTSMLIMNRQDVKGVVPLRQPLFFFFFKKPIWRPVLSRLIF